MLAIENIEILSGILEKEDPDWQITIFDEIGVWVEPKGTHQYDWDIYSACGRSTLDEDVESSWIDGKETAMQVEIKSITELKNYILESSTYRDILKNVNYGQFSKSDLFWALQYRIMKINLYEGEDHNQIYGLQAIHTEGDRLWIDVSACGIDEIPGIYLEKPASQTTLEEAVTKIASEIQSFYRDQPDWQGTVPGFKVNHIAPYKVPGTYSEVILAVSTLQY